MIPGRVRALLASLASLVVVLVLAGPAVSLEQPDPPVLFPDDPDLQQAYEDGFDTGYSVGSDDGFTNGRREAREQSSLRDDVADAAQDDPVEGGTDLGDEIESTPTPAPTDDPTDDPDTTGSSAPSVVLDRTADDDGFDVPWWPIAFAVAATAWFVTRRARPDDD